MATITDLRALLEHELEDLYSAETQLIDALPKLAERASDKQLKKAIKDHLNVTKQQRKRLDQVQQLLGNEKASPENKGFFARLFSSSEGQTHCKAMEGLIKEADSLMGEDMDAAVMDAAIIAAAQKVEHYEISSYGTARAYALQLGEKEVAALLAETLAEEYDADQSLTKLALGSINADAEDEIAARFRDQRGSDDTEEKEEASNDNANAASRKPDNKSAAKKTSTAAPKKTAAKSAKKAAPKKSAAKKSAAKKAAKKKR